VVAELLMSKSSVTSYQHTATPEDKDTPGAEAATFPGNGIDTVE